MTEQAVSQTLTSASAGSIDLSAELLGDSSRAATLLTELRVIVSQDSQFLWRLTDSSPDGSEVSFCQERQDGYLFITKKYTSLGRAEFVAGLAKGEGNTIFVQDDDHHLSLLFNRIGSKYDHLVSLGATLGFDSACDWQETTHRAGFNTYGSVRVSPAKSVVSIRG